jgi:uncharacterized protein (DUF58 family)
VARIALLALAVVAVLIHNPPLLTLAGFLLVLSLLSRALLRHVVSSVEVRRRFRDRAFVGDSLEVELTLFNRSRFPLPWVEVTEVVSSALRAGGVPARILTLAGRQERRFSYTVICGRRGYFGIGPLRMESADLLGGDDLLISAEETNRLVVYPRIVPLARLGLPTRSPQATVPAPLALFEDPTRVMGAREYRPGDPARRIHWRATARTGRLSVKQYAPAIDRETLLCVGLDITIFTMRSFSARQTVEAGIVTAASLAHHISIREGLPVGLLIDGYDPLVRQQRRFAIPPRVGREVLTDILEVLARIDPSTGQDFPELVLRQSASLPWGATVVVIVPEVEPRLADALVSLRRRGHAVSVLLIRPDTPPRPLGALTSIPVHCVWQDADLAALA